MPQLVLSDWLSLAGIIVSLLGFWLSLAQIRKTKSAAESARDTAIKTTESVRKLDSLVGFSSVSKSLDEIKEALHRHDYQALIKQFDNTRKALIDARENHPSLSSQHGKSIQKALSFLKTLEVEVRTSDEASIKLQHAKFMDTLVEISDDVTTILITTKNMERRG